MQGYDIANQYSKCKSKPTFVISPKSLREEIFLCIMQVKSSASISLLFESPVTICLYKLVWSGSRYDNKLSCFCDCTELVIMSTLAGILRKSDESPREQLVILERKPAFLQIQGHGSAKALSEHVVQKFLMMRTSVVLETFFRCNVTFLNDSTPCWHLHMFKSWTICA